MKYKGLEDMKLHFGDPCRHLVKFKQNLYRGNIGGLVFC